MPRFLKLLTNKLKTFCEYHRDRRLKVLFKELIRFRIYIPLRRFHGFLMDRYYGIDTEGIVELPQLGIDKDVGSRQESTPLNHISKIMRTLEMTPNDVFIDMGSGKGRIMLAAGRYPFKGIIGVDVSDELNKICARNIQKMKSRLRCKDFVNITSNVIDYSIPDDATFVFFFNPFKLDVMNAVINRVKESVNLYHRLVTIIWYNPKYEIEFERIHNLKKTREINWQNFGLYRSRCVFYEINW